MMDLTIEKQRLRDLENADKLSPARIRDEYVSLLALLRRENEYALLKGEELKALELIPIDTDVLSFFGDYHVLCNTLRSANFHFLHEIFDIDRITFLSLRGTGLKKWKEFIAFRAALAMSLDKFLAYYDLCYGRTAYPILEEGREYSICEKFALAYEQITARLAKIGEYKEPVKKKLEELLSVMVMGKERNVIAKELHLTAERVRQKQMGFVRQIRRGYLDCAPQVFVSHALLEELSNFEASLPRYKAEGTVYEFLGCKDFDKTVMPFFMSLKKVPESEEVGPYYYTFDQCYFIPCNEQLDGLKSYMGNLYKVFKGDGADVRPQTLSQVMDTLAELDPDREYLEDIVLGLLNQHSWIEQLQEGDETKYQMAYSHLQDYQKLARIIFEKKRVTIAEVEAIDRERSTDGCFLQNVTPTFGVARVHYSWVCNGGQAGVYAYDENGKSVPQMYGVIRGFTEDMKLFRFEDVLAYLKSTGWYQTLNEDTVRAYILKSCQPENNDKNLFCHSDYVGDYSDYSWRSRTQVGIVNWVISRAIAYLKDAENRRMKATEIVSRLKDETEEKRLNYRLANAAFFLRSFSGPDNILEYSDDDKYVTLTAKGLELTEVEIAKLGTRNVTPDYYREVVATIQSLLRSSESGMMLLRDVRAACEETLERDLDTRFYRIVDRYLPDQIVKVHKDGDAYLKLVEENIDYAPAMVIDVQQAENTEISAPKLVEQQEEPTVVVSQPGVRSAFSWEELAQDMETQLAFYMRWWNLKASLQESIVKFKDFIDGLENRRLSQLLPQYMFEFWHCKNDEFDYFHYLTELAICYEQVLVQIHKSNTGVRLAKSGLATIVSQIDEVQDWLDNGDTSYDGFRKVYGNLSYVRNKLAHGEDWNDTLVSIIQKISSFIALYVYTVAKFLK